MDPEKQEKIRKLSRAVLLAAIEYGDALHSAAPLPTEDRKSLFDATHAVLGASEAYANAMREMKEEKT